LQNQISLKVRLIGEQQIIQGEINDFCLYLSEFNPEKRHSTKHYVIHPCSISLNGSTPENKGLHLSLQSTHIKICISPAIIELWNNVSQTLTTTEQSAEDMCVEEIDHSHLWDVKPFDEDQFWFIRVGEFGESFLCLCVFFCIRSSLYSDEAEDALSMASLSLEEVKPELCLVDVPSIIVIIEAGSGVHTIPMLYLETSLEAKVNNWSSEVCSVSHYMISYSFVNCS
jgi:vacuolar protein sorting-associated protein 13A/C